MKLTITYSDIAKAQTAACEARARVRETGVMVREAREDLINGGAKDVMGSIVNGSGVVSCIKRLARHGRADAAALMETPVFVAALEAENAHDAALIERDQAEKFSRALDSVFAYQVRYVVGVALLEHADQWEGKPARYKRTHKTIESIASAALEGTGINVYAGNSSYTTYVSFWFNSGTARGFDFKPVDMDVDGAGNLRTTYFAHWYGDYSHAEQYMGLTPAAVRRACKRHAADVERVRAMGEKYRAAVKGIHEKYAYMGDMRDEFERVELHL